MQCGIYVHIQVPCGCSLASIMVEMHTYVWVGWGFALDRLCRRIPMHFSYTAAPSGWTFRLGRPGVGSAKWLARLCVVVHTLKPAAACMAVGSGGGVSTGGTHERASCGFGVVSI